MAISRLNCESYLNSIIAAQFLHAVERCAVERAKSFWQFPANTLICACEDNLDQHFRNLTQSWPLLLHPVKHARHVPLESQNVAVYLRCGHESLCCAPLKPSCVCPPCCAPSSFSSYASRCDPHRSSPSLRSSGQAKYHRLLRC